jgi:membrane protein
MRRRLDLWQRRHTAAALAVAVARKFADDHASGLAALVAYYAFFSIFPLLLVFVSLVGFLAEDADLRKDIVDTLFAEMPVIGPQVRGEVDALTGSTPALALGLVAALLGGLGLTLAIGRAFARVWDVAPTARPHALAARVRGLVMLLLVGASVIAATVVAGIAAAGAVGDTGERVLGFTASIAFDVAFMFVLFRLGTPAQVPRRVLVPGVLAAAAGWLVLQSIGGLYVEHTVRRASDTYGMFAAVIGLLSWLWLFGRLLLVAAELNVVLAERLWPRSLGGPLTDADRRALRRSAQAARRDPRERIAVSFADEGERQR